MVESLVVGPIAASRATRELAAEGHCTKAAGQPGVKARIVGTAASVDSAVAVAVVADTADASGAHYRSQTASHFWTIT